MLQGGPRPHEVDDALGDRQRHKQECVRQAVTPLAEIVDLDQQFQKLKITTSIERTSKNPAGCYGLNSDR